MKKNYPTNVKDVWTNLFYMPFIIISGSFVFIFAIGFTLVGKEELKSVILEEGILVFFIKRYIFSFCLYIIYTLSITLMAFIVAYFSTKDMKEPIAVFKTTFIFHSICAFIGCIYFIYYIYK